MISPDIFKKAVEEQVGIGNVKNYKLCPNGVTCKCIAYCGFIHIPCINNNCNKRCGKYHFLCKYGINCKNSNCIYFHSNRLKLCKYKYKENCISILTTGRCNYIHPMKVNSTLIESLYIDMNINNPVRVNSISNVPPINVHSINNNRNNSVDINRLDINHELDINNMGIGICIPMGIGGHMIGLSQHPMGMGIGIPINRHLLDIHQNMNPMGIGIGIPINRHLLDIHQNMNPLGMGIGIPINNLRLTEMDHFPFGINRNVHIL